MKIWRQNEQEKAEENVKPPPLDRKIVKMCLSNRRRSCRKISSGPAAQGFEVHRRMVNRRLFKVGLKAYRPRKKPRLTEKMKASRHAGLWSTVIGLQLIGSR